MTIDWLPLLPILTAAFGGLLLLMIEAFLPIESPGLFGGVTLTVLGFAAGFSALDWILHPAGTSSVLFGGSLTVDSFAQFFNILLSVAAALTVVSAWNYLPREKMGHGETYSMILFALSGMMTLAAGTSLITLFVGLEVMSLAIYVLVGARRQSVKGSEAALKYFFLGSFASGLLLYGTALIYGMTGSVQFDAIQAALAHPDPTKFPLTVVGMALIVVGLSFKVAAAPFHTWAPDVYEGAPAPITGFMATAVKAAAFAFFLRVLGVAFMPLKANWEPVLVTLSILTMFAGNLMAFVQTNIKRMLAFSGVAHTGYLLMGLVALTAAKDAPTASAMLYYLVAYTLTNIGAFAIIAFLSKQGEKLTEIKDFAGVASKFPGLAFLFAICMASLIGFPPTAGFFAKYTLITAVLSQGYTALAVVAIFNSILSIYYYMKPVVMMYMQEPRVDWTGATGIVPARIVGVVTVVAILWAGIGATSLLSVVPGAQPLLSWAHTSVASLF